VCNFDPAKPVQTRDGRPARIVSTNMGGRYPILAIIDEGKEGDHASRYTMKGRFMTAPGESELDLVNVPDPTLREEIAYVNLGGSYSVINPARSYAEFPVVKLTLKVGRNGVEDAREIVSAELL
jgi:hypothetical protein